MKVFGAWSPDLPAFGGTHATEALNVLPQTDRSYGPIRALTTVSRGFGLEPRGLHSAVVPGVANLTFAGGPDSLVSLNADGTWEERTRRDGSDVLVPYALGDEDRWEFVTYRNRVVATAGLGEKIQTFLLGTDEEFQDLDDVGTGTPPNARHIAIARDFVMVGDTYDSVDGATPSRVWWSAIGDPTTWPTPGSVDAQAVQSDFRDLPGGGRVQAIIPGLGGADAVVFCERRIWRATFVGPPVQFDFQVIDPSRGLYAPYAVATNGQIAIYLAEDGWYAFDGAQSTPIGADTIDRWFLARLDDSKLHRISSAMDAEQKMLFVAYPAGNSSFGMANQLLCLNWETGRWTHVDLRMMPTSSGAAPEIAVIASLRSIGFTLDGLDALGYTLDTLPFSLDSRQWAGGAAYMGVLEPGGNLSSFSGTTLEALIEGPEEAGDAAASNRMMIQGVRPYIDSGSVSCSLKLRNGPGEAYSQTPWTPVARDGVAYQRANARFARTCVKVPAGTDWTHLQGYDLVGVVPAGVR